MGLFVFWFGMAVVTSIAAHARGRSAGAWFVLGFLGSAFALIAVLVLPRVQPEPPAASFASAPQTAALNGAASAAEEIEKLAQLRDKGILTDAEFQARKELVLKA